MIQLHIIYSLTARIIQSHPSHPKISIQWPIDVFASTFNIVRPKTIWKDFIKKKPQVIFEIWTGCFLWRRINRWTGCRDHSTVTYWSSVDKALPFNSNWQESRLLNRESSSFLPRWQLHGRVWGIETLPNVKPRYIITELPQFWRQQAVTTVFCHQILCSQTNTDKVQTNTDNSVVLPNTLFSD